MFSNKLTRTALAILLCGAAISTTSCSSSPSVSGMLPSAYGAAKPLIDAVAAAVPGLSQAQAILGAGSALSLAKDTMPADQFKSVSNIVPGAEALMGNAVGEGLPASGNSISGVKEFLAKKGITPEQSTALFGAVGNFMQGKVPGPVSDAFAMALK